MIKSLGQSLGQVSRRANSEPFPTETRKTQIMYLRMLKESAPAQLSALGMSQLSDIWKILAIYLSSLVLTVPVPQCPGYLIPSTELPDNRVSAAPAPRTSGMEQESLLGTTLHNTSSTVTGNLSLSTASKQD